MGAQAVDMDGRDILICRENLCKIRSAQPDYPCSLVGAASRTAEVLLCNKRQRDQRHFLGWRSSLWRRAGHLHIFVVLGLAVGLSSFLGSIDHVCCVNGPCAFPILPAMKIEEHPGVA